MRHAPAPAWRKVSGGWQRVCDGKFVPQAKKSGARAGDARTLMVRGSLRMSAACACGWSGNFASLSAANEAWWRHEDETASDGRSHTITYTEA